MHDRSMHLGCPVPLEALAYVTVRHWGFDGAVHTGELIIARDLADEMLDIFEELFAAHYPIERVSLVDDFDGNDDRSMAANNTSAFNCRPNTTDPSRYSEHSYGAAIDINPLINPYVRGDSVLPPAGTRYLDRGQHVPGLIVRGDACHRAFMRRGWTWGGDFRTLKDYQHFERARSPR
jgi:hypothetical protein